MKIAEGLDILELGNEERRMNATLIWDDKNVILIDAGLPGQIENIREEVKKAGVSFDRINKIIITHHDLDHIGGLSSIVKNSKSEIEVLAHSGERPYIEGDKIGIKITPERLSSMPESMKETIKQLKTKVNRIVKDEENLPYCGGIDVIYTPGHTPGHICLYLRKYKALVTGDAMNVVNNELIGPNPEYTFDMEEAMESLKKLTKYDIETVICYHGGVFTKGSNERIAKLANS
ncbi:MBL fold metallo-hydrolase [Clostridium beijerinckii]|uniref:Glyoxylase-like metal-dependent hydrolase (Beta-lactamase superfamily II) n=1 Tax=Clostridium beijerinckii TaxID=1520 RepID=A0A9Q5GN54_CLOBE|nr:MBL fold metallo-hydrolase [Clostridium beijerinckii]AQS06080.1 putative metallo-hydrolase YflN [Clostridium beijerinckii]MBA2886116.1 glyoxylase-like metal-dependent hydrolase (beta-lactamase superfamily II) [Clostridium beijerinckii]MBA2901026.1 glyoxylase-like metal-dependent hydrolase (beta-lactamase superfamily II) [Clostridium beijerinckii]MBA2910675.1 glyoxylase-like metal-dependent hydrolase (beta-lactamase superfamily II) [Clostridium beijerinckii]MBA9014314.1 glyoxylase-like metal